VASLLDPTLFGGLDVPLSPPRGVARKKRQLAIPSFTRPDGWAPHTDLPELHGNVILDLENKDEGLARGQGSSWYRHDGGFIAGVAIGWEQGDFYVPMRHSEGNTDPDRAIRWLKAQAKKPDVTFTYCNGGYDLGWLRANGIEPLNLPHDVQAQAALLDEFKMNYSLDALGLEYLGEGKADDAFKEACQRGGLIDPMSHMDMVPAWLAEAYALQDVRLTRKLFSCLSAKITEEKLDKIYDLERECILVAVDMKAMGVRLDLDRVERTKKHFAGKRDEYIQLVFEQTGVHVDPFDDQSIIRALKEENANVVLPLTDKGKESIRAEVLEGLPSTPIVEAIRWMRKYDKAIGTTLNGLLEHQYKGRIHADFNPLRRSDETGAGGTVSGRFSCTNPNLQNIPIRIPEIGVPVRACFVPEDRCQWAKLDYASQEPRLTIHYASLLKLKGAWAMVERFRLNPNTDLHKETAMLMFGHTAETWEMLEPKVRKVLRQRAKVINLAIAYGAGGANIAGQLGLPTKMREFTKGDGSLVRYLGAGDEAQALLDKQMAAVPFLRKLQKAAKERAEDLGYVTTILGRRCRFKKYGDEYGRSHKALNSVIQGSAADQMKMALVLLRRAGITVPLSVHDEGDISVPRGASAFIAQVKQIMEEAVILNLPVVAEVLLGDNWGSVSVD
jgi:DNA polymerase I-like protein with 3'-5' exonuclease and polymerase domains